MSYDFILSYARRDRDEYLKRFYEHLVDAVGRLKKPSDEKIGFIDAQGIEPGDAWPDELADALQASRVLVNVYSPAYFGRPYCGKEWRVFSSRLDEYARQFKVRPPAILPILWVPENRLPRPLPRAAFNVQYKHDDLGELGGR